MRGQDSLILSGSLEVLNNWQRSLAISSNLNEMNESIPCSFISDSSEWNRDGDSFVNDLESSPSLTHIGSCVEDNLVCALKMQLVLHSHQVAIALIRAKQKMVRLLVVGHCDKNRPRIPVPIDARHYAPLPRLTRSRLRKVSFSVYGVSRSIFDKKSWMSRGVGTQ